MTTFNAQLEPLRHCAQSYPTAYIPMLLYTSDVLHRSKLHWLQWPVKYRLLTTSHSNTGRGFQWLLMHFEHIWCYDAVARGRKGT